MKHQITGSKLPSRGDCLKVLMYNLRMTKLNLNESAALVTDECLVFWRKARIPTQEPHKCKEKFKKFVYLYEYKYLNILHSTRQICNMHIIPW